MFEGPEPETWGLRSPSGPACRKAFDNRGMVSGAGDVQGLTKGFGFLGGKLGEGLANFGLHGFDLGPEFLVGHDLVSSQSARTVLIASASLVAASPETLV